MHFDQLSLIVPTRERPEQLRRLLDSLATTTAEPARLEIILVIDADDASATDVGDFGLNVQRVTMPPGQTMGALNQAGYAASHGRYIMLLNDDVVARTSSWDHQVRKCFDAFPDDIALVHVNDLVFQRQLCTFPIVSRKYCDLVGGICPTGYRRYRIDDHIEDHFNLLHALGECRTVYTPDVIFEHANYVTNAAGLRQYFSDPTILTLDAPHYEQLFPDRKRAALKLLAQIQNRATMSPRHERRLNGIKDSFALRVADRQRILTPTGIVEPWIYDKRPPAWSRLVKCVRERGFRGLLQAAKNRCKTP